MTNQVIILIAITVGANTAASLLLKKAALLSANRSVLALPASGMAFTAAAVCIYGVAFFLYGMVLRELPVSKAYTMITFGAQAALILVGALYFGERYSPTAWFGVLLVLAGIFLIGRSEF